jgi:GMP synthase-like glutamine amidotransferase
MPASKVPSTSIPQHHPLISHTQIHQDQVTVVPENHQILASSEACPVQVLLNPGRALTFQGHPGKSQLLYSFDLYPHPLQNSL